MRIGSSDEGLKALKLTALGNARGVMRPVEMHPYLRAGRPFPGSVPALPISVRNRFSH
jgi:hypothetical protein